jgi:hypothetical protein
MLQGDSASPFEEVWEEVVGMKHCHRFSCRKFSLNHFDLFWTSNDNFIP